MLKIVTAAFDDLFRSIRAGTSDVAVTTAQMAAPESLRQKFAE